MEIGRKISQHRMTKHIKKWQRNKILQELKTNRCLINVSKAFIEHFQLINENQLWVCLKFDLRNAIAT